MPPTDQIRAKYHQYPQERPFDYYLDLHLQIGFVFSTPDYFIMGRPIIKALAEDWVNDPWRYASRRSADCWYVHAMAGDVKKVWEILPWPMPWIAFERIRDGKRELQILKLERLRALCLPDEVATPS